MKLGIFSDVHANLEALSRVVETLRDRGATQFFCAGDIVGYGPDPAACIDVVRGLRATVVAGNHDWGAVGRHPAGAFNERARAALAWTIRQLGEAELACLDSLALVEKADPVHLVHASPAAPAGWEYIVSAGECEEAIDSFALPLCIIGHSHHPFAVERRDGATRVLPVEGFTVRPGGRYLVNVGSVGQPRDGDPRACCALYDTARREFSLFRVAYDIPAVQARIRQAGLPAFLADRLAIGR
ncbi:MAG: metallophosphoesterase family protein [bacterium]